MQQLETIISAKEVKRRTNIRTNEYHKKQRRNENGLTPKQQEMLDLKLKALELINKGFSIRKTAKELHVTPSKVQRALNK